MDCDVGIFSVFSINPSSPTYAQPISGIYLPHKMLIQLEKIPEGKAVAKTLSGSGDENKDSGKTTAFPHYQSQLPLPIG